MLDAAESPDKHLIADIRSGFKLTGIGRDSGSFIPKANAAAISEEELKKSATWTRKAVMSGSHLTEKDTTACLWKETLLERDKGWLEGPYSDKQAETILGTADFTVTRRCGLQQATKVRSIDDYSASHVNSAFTALEKLTLPGVDEIAGTIRILSKHTLGPKDIRVKLPCGEVLSGTQHKFFNEQEHCKLVGSTLDLQDAYRQLSLDAGGKWCSVLAVEHPELNRPFLFIQWALHARDRVGISLWLIGVKLFKLIWANFVDDFPHVEVECLAAHALQGSEGFLKLLNWTFSLKETKRRPFAQVFDARYHWTSPRSARHSSASATKRVE